MQQKQSPQGIQHEADELAHTAQRMEANLKEAGAFVNDWKLSEPVKRTIQQCVSHTVLLCDPVDRETLVEAMEFWLNEIKSGRTDEHSLETSGEAPA